MNDRHVLIPDLFRTLRAIAERTDTATDDLSESFIAAYIALEYDLRNCVQVGFDRRPALLSKAYAAKLLGGVVYAVGAAPSPEMGALAEEFGVSDHIRALDQDARGAAAYLSQTAIRIDMLHLNGTRTAQAIQDDIDALAPLLGDGAWIILGNASTVPLRAIHEELKRTYGLVFDDGHCVMLRKVANGPALSVAEKGALQALAAMAKQSSDEVESLRDHLDRKEREIQALNDALMGAYASSSWRFTRPLRSFKQTLLKARAWLQVALYRLKRAAKPFRPRRATRGNKISVVITSYNHEKYIAQCLDSVLMQNGYFSLEIILGDDCSPDSTPAIMRRYQERYPDLVRIMPSERNVGVTQNIKRCLAACTGAFIAMCEGDDYWSDEYKLQKQMEFLIDHPDYSMCFSSILLEQEGQSGLIPSAVQLRLNKDELTTEDLIEVNSIGNFSCCMYRAETVRKLPPQIYDIYTVDWMFNMACAELGRIGFLREPMSVYRLHAHGAWTGKLGHEQAEFLLGLLEPYNRLLGGKYERQFAKQRARLQESLGTPPQAAVETPTT